MATAEFAHADWNPSLVARIWKGLAFRIISSLWQTWAILQPRSMKEAASSFVEARIDLASRRHDESFDYQMTMRYAHLAPDHQQAAIDGPTVTTAQVTREQCTVRIATQTVSYPCKVKT
jgi:hypothetical protein